jgi:adenylosuccinate lyase
MLTALSPLDGRYSKENVKIKEYFSEYALIKYRIYVEIEYLKALIAIPLPQLAVLPKNSYAILDSIFAGFDLTGAEKIKEIERITNHDVKAVEYYIKQKLIETPLAEFSEFVHFGLTSQDINNTAVPLMVRDALEKEIVPMVIQLIETLKNKAYEYRGIPMLARTHGQPASPTTVGKELEVFCERLTDEIDLLNSLKLKCKFGGATGNFNAHKVAYPQINWIEFANKFTSQLGIQRSQTTTQIAHYDDLAGLFHNFIRINTILIDCCRDMWTYISMDYFKQKIKEGEIGSSAMPHKVNPIDFENAEGNFGIANSLFSFMAEKLPISRLQRDLTDSTVIRNIGVPFGHSLIAYKAMFRGLNKLMLNRIALESDLNTNWIVVAEAIQSILRRELYHEPYEVLKELTRGKSNITQNDLVVFIDSLDVSSEVKDELKNISPFNYVGYF